MHNPFNLSNKTILVTGASSGIGKSIAIECSKSNARLIITGRNSVCLNETLHSMIGDNHLIYTLDLNNDADLIKLVNEIPKIDGIVHSAGITKLLPFTFTTRDMLNSIMDINFFATVELTRQIVKLKKINDSGSIVFISSVSGVLCSSHANSAYSASKGAINGIMKGIALDLSSKKIRVNSINPGFVETNLYRNEDISIETKNQIVKDYPLMRLGKPEDIAYAAIFLLSDASLWVTGSNIVIDGGLTLK